MALSNRGPGQCDVPYEPSRLGEIRRSPTDSHWEVLTLLDSTGYERWEPLGTRYVAYKYVEFGVESVKVFKTLAELLEEEGWAPPEEAKQLREENWKLRWFLPAGPPRF